MSLFATFAVRNYKFAWTLTNTVNYTSVLNLETGSNEVKTMGMASDDQYNHGSITMLLGVELGKSLPPTFRIVSAAIYRLGMLLFALIIEATFLFSTLF